MQLQKKWFIALVILYTPAYSYVDFDTSMQTQEHPGTLSSQHAQMLLACMRALFEKNHPELVQPSSQLKIPKIIHHIWFGGKLPTEYVPFRASWVQGHPDWTFIFWTDNPINFDQGELIVKSFEQLKQCLSQHRAQFIVVDIRSLEFDNRHFMDQAPNYGEKSDILKWEVVHRCGGLYVDTDFECLRSLEHLHYMYDFYTGIQPLDTNMVQLGAALYAAYPGHPILKRCVEGIKENQHTKQIIVKTGPIHFTKSFCRVVGQHIDVALPATYFYPCSYGQKGLGREVWQRPESLAIHHWAGSWLKPEAFEKKKS